MCLRIDRDTFMTQTVSRPSMALLSSEPWRAAGDLLDHIVRPSPVAPRSPDAHTVILFPGLASAGLALWPLREYLTALGYRALDWGQGLNTGPRGNLDDWLSSLRHSVLDRADEGGHDTDEISLVGWSLGGLYAREIAKLVPGRIRQVVTLGTPFNGGRRVTNVEWVLKLLNRDSPADSSALRARLAQPPPVPTTALFSRSDGIVAWQACRHGRTGDKSVRDIEVHTSHMSMGWNRSVLKTVARELARRPTRW